MSDNGMKTRWKKDQSGNPAGRAPNHNNMSDILKRVLGETFMTTTGENPRDITRLEVILNAMVGHAERGDKTCLNILMKEMRHIDDRDAIVNSPAEQSTQKMKEASQSLVRKMNEFRAEEDPDYRPPPDPLPVYGTEEKPEEDAPQSAQDAQESLIRKMQAFRDEEDEDDGNPPEDENT
jgi:hypothetical protein